MYLLLLMLALFSFTQISEPTPVPGLPRDAVWSMDTLFALSICGIEEKLCLLAGDGIGEALVIEEAGSYISGFAWQQSNFQEPQVAFTKLDEEGDLEIYTLHAATSKVEQITFNQTDDRSPSWSPDGRYIAYVATGRESNYAWDTDIHIIDIRTGEDRQLTHDGEYRHVQDGSPSWSPDGNYIAYQSDWGSQVAGESLDYDIHVINVDGSSDPVRLTTRHGYDGVPTWSWDGRYIAFVSNYEGDGQNANVIVWETKEILPITHFAANESAAYRVTWRGLDLVYSTFNPVEGYVLFAVRLDSRK